MNAHLATARSLLFPAKLFSIKTPKAKPVSAALLTFDQAKAWKSLIHTVNCGTHKRNLTASEVPITHCTNDHEIVEFYLCPLASTKGLRPIWWPLICPSSIGRSWRKPSIGTSMIVVDVVSIGRAASRVRKVFCPENLVGPKRCVHRVREHPVESTLQNVLVPRLCQVHTESAYVLVPLL